MMETPEDRQIRLRSSRFSPTADVLDFDVVSTRANLSSTAATAPWASSQGLPGEPGEVTPPGQAKKKDTAGI
jgi:hypothetical protein